MPIRIKFSKALLERFPYAFKLFWDTKWRQVTIMYNARGAGYIDIRKVFNVTAEGEAALNALVEEKGWRNLEMDERVYQIMLYVTRRLTYTNDSKQFGKVEFWADPYTTWLNRTDDCDGYAVLLAYLGWLAGVPRWRLKVVAGDVDLNGNLVGHAYCLYLKEADNLWYTLEGPYWPDKARARFREGVPHSEASNYEDFWWTTTDELSWSQHDLTIDHGVGA